MSKKALLLIYLFILISILFAQNTWQGNATVSQYGEFPPEGYYAASNAFPVNSIVEVTNIENGKTTSVIITRGLNEEGLLLLLSADAARDLEVPIGSIARIKATLSAASQKTSTDTNSQTNAVKDVDLNPAVTIPQEIIDNPPTPTPPPWEAIVSLDKPRETQTPGEVVLDSSLIAPEASVIPSPTPSPTPSPSPTEQPVLVRPEPVTSPTPSPSLVPTPTPAATIAATRAPETLETSLDSPSPTAEKPIKDIDVEPNVPTPSPTPTPVPVLTTPTPTPGPEPISVIAAKKTESPLSGVIEQLNNRQPAKTLAIPPRKENPFVFLPEPKILIDLTDKDIVVLPEASLPEEELPQISMDTFSPQPQPSYIPSLSEPVLIAEGETQTDDTPSISFLEPTAPPKADIDIPLVEPQELMKEEIAALSIEQPSIPDTTFVVPQEDPSFPREEIAEASMTEPTPSPQPTAEPGGDLELALVPAEERPPSPAPTTAPTEEDLLIEGIVDALSPEPSIEPTPTPVPTPSPTPSPVQTPAPVIAKELPLVESLEKDSYYVQLGAYKTTSTALKLINKMGINYPVVALPLEKDGKIIYRILVGPLNHDESGTLIYWFKAQGFKDAFVQRGE